NIAGPGPCLGTWDANPHEPELTLWRHHPQTRPHRVHEVTDGPDVKSDPSWACGSGQTCVDSLAGSLSTVDLPVHPVYCPVRAMKNQEEGETPFIIENLRLRELVAIVNANRAFFEEFEGFL